MPYNAPNAKNVYKGGKLPPLLVVTSEKIVMKEELECTFRFKKFTLLFNNGKNGSDNIVVFLTIYFALRAFS
mgnify:FL=1